MVSLKNFDIRNQARGNVFISGNDESARNTLFFP